LKLRFVWLRGSRPTETARRRPARPAGDPPPPRARVWQHLQPPPRPPQTASGHGERIRPRATMTLRACHISHRPRRPTWSGGMPHLSTVRFRPISNISRRPRLTPEHAGALVPSSARHECQPPCTAQQGLSWLGKPYDESFLLAADEFQQLRRDSTDLWFRIGVHPGNPARHAVPLRSLRV
jgi:hypothetical protein